MFNFTVKEFIIGNGTPTLQFYKRGFNINGGGQPSWQDVILSGNTALTLVNAKANGLNYLKLFGGIEQRNLPSGYTQLEYLESTGTQYIDLGYISPERAKTLRFVTDMSIDTNSSSYRLCGSGYTNRQLYFGFSSSGTFAYGPGNVDAKVDVYGKVGIKYHYDYDALNGSYKVSENGTIVASKQFEFSGYTGGNFYLFCYAGTNEVPTSLWSGKIYSFLVYENNTLIQNLIPCRRNSDNVLGMYDTVTGNFLTNVGTGTFTAGSTAVPSPDTPIDIISNNGVLKLSPNLFNKDLVPNANEYVNKITGNASSPTSGEFRHSDFIVIKENTQYYVGIISSIATSAGLAFYDDTETYLSGMSLTELGYNNNIITSPTNTKYIRFSFRIDEGYNTNWQNTVYFVEGNQPLAEFIPYGQIYADGTAEKVEVFGKNLYNDSADVVGYAIDASGNIISASVSSYSSAIPVHPGQYTYSGVCSRQGTANNKRIHGYMDGVWIQQIDVVVVQAGGVFNHTFTVPSGINEIRISHWSGDINTQLEPGSTATTYKPYFNGGSATAEMLLKVGDYKDVQSVLDGSVTRNVGIKVFDGTEDWTLRTIGTETTVYQLSISALQSMNIDYAYNSNITTLCSHYNTHIVTNSAQLAGAQVGFYIFVNVEQYPNSRSWYIRSLIDNLDAFKQWLADQYNAGTPVIVVYPLEVPTTETVTGQPMVIQDGTNIVEITQASVDNLELEVSYKAGVAVTITEVENAQLDNNVEVTING
jgi:hypothetical protein